MFPVSPVVTLSLLYLNFSVYSVLSVVQVLSRGCFLCSSASLGTLEDNEAVGILVFLVRIAIDATYFFPLFGIEIWKPRIPGNPSVDKGQVQSIGHGQCLGIEGGTTDDHDLLARSRGRERLLNALLGHRLPSEIFVERLLNEQGKPFHAPGSSQGEQLAALFIGDFDGGPHGANLTCMHMHVNRLGRGQRQQQKNFLSHMIYDGLGSIDLAGRAGTKGSKR